MRNEIPFAILDSSYTGESLFPLTLNGDAGNVAVRYLPDDEDAVQAAAEALGHVYFLSVDSQRLVHRVSLHRGWDDEELGQLVPGRAPPYEMEMTVDGRTFHVQPR